MRPTADGTAEEAARLGEQLRSLRGAIARVIVGQEEVVRGLLVTLLASGHALLEGVPGLAKTLLVRTVAEALELRFHRIQFTPDLMPSDIVGTEVLEEDQTTGKRIFRFERGPVFANLVLADEVNRSPPKTQSALLEAMQEHAVTWGGETMPLEEPFFVLATQNPIEQTGTYPLPEAQLDRFLLHLRIDYPGEADELAIYRRTTSGERPTVAPVMTAADIVRAQALVRDVYLSDDLLAYAGALVRATRPHTSAVKAVRDYVDWGAGPRAGQALILAAKAGALLDGRYAVTLDDLRRLVPSVLRHRVLLSFRAQAEGVTADDIAADVLQQVPKPHSPLG